MWTNAQLKEKAKFALKMNYWKTVFVSLLIAMLLGGVGYTYNASGFSSDLESDLEDFNESDMTYADYYGITYSDQYGDDDNSESYWRGYGDGTFANDPERHTGDYKDGYIDGFLDSYGYDEYEGDFSSEVEDLLLDGESTDDELEMAAVFSVLLIFIVIFLVVMVIAMAISLVTSAFIFNPIDVGAKRFFFKNLNQKAEVKEVAFVFDSNYLNVVKILFFRDLYTMLWSMLFIIPGIVKSYEYLMIPYLLAENPNLTKEQAFALSKQMMKGQKAEAWFLDLSFIGWHILSAFTMGILDIFYVTPYKNLTFAALYEQLSYMNGRPAYGQPNMGNPNQQMNPYVQPVQQAQPVPPVPQMNVENNNTKA